MKSLKKKLCIVCAAIAAVCCGALGMVEGKTTAAAEEVVTPSITIESNNLSYSDSIYMLYAVSNEGFDRTQNQIQLLFWEEAQAEYTYGSQTNTVTSMQTATVKEKDCLVYYSRGLAAKEMTTDLYARAYVEVDGVAYYSEVSKFSVIEYVYTMRDNTIDAETEALFTKMLDYGAAAQTKFQWKTDRLATADYYKVEVVNGALEDGREAGRFFANETAVLVANPAPEGYKFQGWKNSVGVVEGETETWSVEVTKAETYTAVYAEILPEFSYILNEDEEGYTLSSIGGYDGADFVVSSEHEGKPVTGIGEGVFSGCNNLTSVVIPASVTSIGNNAFADCDSLASVYYAGTESNWEKVAVGENNDGLTDAIIYYYSATKPATGNCWYYINDEIIRWGDTAVISIKDYAAGNEWKDSTKYTEITNAVAKITVTGGGNTGKYYTNGNNWRMYQNESPSIVVSSERKILYVKVTYDVSNTGVLVQGTTQISSDALVSVNANSITFGVGNTGSATNGQVRITAITVVVEAHDHVFNTAVTNPTCTEDGYTTYTCTICGMAYKSDKVPATGHNYGEEVTAPTCTEEGYTTYTCACGDSYTGNVVEATGHNYVDGTCACGAQDPNYAAHEHSYTEVETAPTCTEEGYTTYTCACGDTYKGNEVGAKGHSYEETMVDATCEKDGLKTYTCACGDTYSEVISATGHSTDNGVCEYCGETISSLVAKTYTYTFTAKQYTANGVKTLNGVNWTLAGDGNYWGYDATKGQQFGSGNAPYKSMTLTSISFSNVSKITINTSGASSTNAKCKVYVGNTQVGTQISLTSSAKEYNFVGGGLTGAVKFEYTQTNSKAIYIKSITVEYAE